jgi:hypothetical protein
MKKLLILFIILLFATAFKFPTIDITGLFLKATSMIVTITKEVVKQVLTIIVRML